MDLLEGFKLWEAATATAPRTGEAYRYALIRLAAAGIVTAADATPGRVALYLTERAKTVSVVTRNYDLAALTGVLTAMSRAQLVAPEAVNALRLLRVKRKVPKRFQARFLSHEEADRLVKGARDGDAEGMIRVALLSGLRAGELARLRWEDVDFVKRTVRVRLLPELGQLGRIKTGSERTVPACQELLEALREIKETRWLRRESVYVFPAKHGLCRSEFRRVKPLREELQRAARKARLSGPINFHVLRHTRASWWAAAGAPLVKISLWLGHSPEVCSRYYAGLVEGYDTDCERGSFAPDEDEIVDVLAGDAS